MHASIAGDFHQKAAATGNDYLKLLPLDSPERGDLSQNICQHEREALRWNINSSFYKVNETAAMAAAFKNQALHASYTQAHLLLDQAIEQATQTHEAFQVIHAHLASQQNFADIKEAFLQHASIEIATWQKNLEEYQQMKTDRKKTCWDSICESFTNFKNFWSSMMPRWPGWSFRRTAVN